MTMYDYEKKKHFINILFLYVLQNKAFYFCLF